MSDSKEVAVIPKVPGCAVIVVGDDIDVNTAVANLVRAGLNYYGCGSSAMAVYEQSNGFVDLEELHEVYGYSDGDDRFHNQASDMWDAICRERPGLSMKLNVGIEIAAGKVDIRQVTTRRASVEFNSKDGKMIAIEQERVYPS